MDLIGVNNSIVNLRKFVIKAKIHVIRQLIRHIKSLKGKKVKNDAQQSQNQRKITRLQSELAIIKHLKKDEVSRFALINKQSFLPDINPDRDAEKMDELLKKRAMVRLSNSTALNKEVEKFRKNYPGWEKDLPRVFKILGKKQKKKDELKKKKKREERKLQKKAQNGETKENDVKEPKEDEEENEDDGQSEDDSSETEDLVEAEESEDEDELETEAVPEVTNGDMEIKQLDLNELIENDDSSDEENQNIPSEPISSMNVDEPSAKVKDSFFLGGSGSDNESEDSGSDENEYDQAEASIDNAMKMKRNDFIDRQSRGSFNSRGRFEDRGRGRGGRGSFRGNDRGRGGRGFNDGGRGRGRGDYHRDRSNDKFSHSSGRGFQDRGRGRGGRGRGRGDFNGYANDSNGQSENLHPSWAAKRSQQKVVITPFSNQSKKIKFDDDNTESALKKPPSSTATNLHPSWAAKKDDKKGIQQFQGKKVVFGDDE